jgi:hypothetical protein
VARSPTNTDQGPMIGVFDMSNAQRFRSAGACSSLTRRVTAPWIQSQSSVKSSGNPASHSWPRNTDVGGLAGGEGTDVGQIDWRRTMMMVSWAELHPKRLVSRHRVSY